jgi:hypothetical protein
VNQIVRRVNDNHALAGESERQPTQIRRVKEMIVSSTRSLGIDPKVHLTWNVLPWYWNKRFRLLVFRSNTGFCPEENPEDLNRHGHLIIQTTHDGEHLEQPGEGTFYYTFLLHKPGWLREKMSIARLAETIPSAKVAIGRIRDRVEFQELMQGSELGAIEHQAKLNEATVRLARSIEKVKGISSQMQSEKNQSKPRDILDERLQAADALISLYAAKRKKLEALENDPTFRALDPKEQQKVRDKIDQLLDPGEISAGRERRGS